MSVCSSGEQCAWRHGERGHRGHPYAPFSLVTWPWQGQMLELFLILIVFGDNEHGQQQQHKNDQFIATFDPFVGGASHPFGDHFGHYFWADVIIVVVVVVVGVDAQFTDACTVHLGVGACVLARGGPMDAHCVAFPVVGDQNERSPLATDHCWPRLDNRDHCR